jgi:ubiquinone/menaquinone biosynthesis C-methylase UbiE
VHAYLREMVRVLAPSGKLLVVSLRGPAVQVPLLEGVEASTGGGGLLRVEEVVEVAVAGRNMMAHVYVCSKA